MGCKYFLHRISHEGDVSYSLLEKGYLTLGWLMMSDTDIMATAREEKYPRFNSIVKERGIEKNRSRWGMWYFANMNIGDIVLVPLYGGKFSVYKIKEPARSISNLENLLNENVKGAWNNHTIIWKDQKLFDNVEKRDIDLGFFIKVEPIVENVPRNYAASALVSRMKIRTTNADISDLGELVERAINAGNNNKPDSFYEVSMIRLVEILKNQIINELDPNDFERLIKWYLDKCGAEQTSIPAKNEPGKEDGADADVIAVFESLKHIIYIQAKHHKGKTSDWAVEQIKRYYDQKSEGDTDYTYASWVISACDTFSDDAIKASKEYKVRLIDGEEFSRMLLDVGIQSIDEAFG